MVSATGDGFWSGGSIYLRALLTRLTWGATESTAAVEEGPSGDRSDYDYVRTQCDWIRADGDGYRLRVGLGDLDAAVGDWIRDRVDGLLDAAK